MSLVRGSGVPEGTAVSQVKGASGNSDVTAAVRDWAPCGQGFVTPVRGRGSLRAGHGGPCEQAVPVGWGLSPAEVMRVPEGRECVPVSGDTHSMVGNIGSEFSW